MSDLPIRLLAQTFERVAIRAQSLAGYAIYSIDDDELHQLHLASESFKTAAAELYAVDVMPYDDPVTFNIIHSLSKRLEIRVELLSNDKKGIGILVDVGKSARDFARSVASGDHYRTVTAMTDIAVLLDAPTGLPIPHYYDTSLGDGGGPGDGSGGGGSPGNGSSHRIQTYAHIEIASSMHLGEVQALKVGIDPQQQANVIGEAMTIVGGYPFDISVTVVAQEFVLRPGETWSNVLRATDELPNPSITLHVTPTSEAGNAESQSRTIAVLYSMNAHTLGYGAVHVDVHPLEIPLKAADESTARAIVTAYPNEVAFDLTIRINDFGDGSGRLKWTFESPHFAIPPEPVTSTIGTAPSDFAAGLIKGVNAASSPKIAALTINGNAKIIANSMPKLFLSVWKQLHDKISKQIPTVLIVSEDAYVPWELAAVTELFDPSAPPLLGAQADVGRWIFSDHGDLLLPPPMELDLAPMVEVTAVYNTAKAPRLKHAEEEGRELARLYGAKHVEATDVAITDCFHGAQPPATTIHIALHGIYDKSGSVDGLIMVNDAVLTPAAIQGATAKNRPFVFLNACQVGTGKEVLGHYAGMPAAFVYAKARGVVAPLWSVDDSPAKELALRFYEGLNDSKSPAAVLRAERKRAADTTASPTSLAYLYYGNPRSRTNPPPISVPLA